MTDPKNPRKAIRLSDLQGQGHRDAAGLVCPKCGCRDFKVYYTRPCPSGIRRARTCRHCGHRITTTERQ